MKAQVLPWTCSKWQEALVWAQVRQQAHVATRLTALQVWHPPFWPKLLALWPGKGLSVHQVWAHKQCGACITCMLTLVAHTTYHSKHRVEARCYQGFVHTLRVCLLTSAAMFALPLLLLRGAGPGGISLACRMS